jgi:hypothetical protein
MNNNIPLIQSEGIDLSFLERKLPKKLPHKDEVVDAKFLEGEIEIVPIPFHVKMDIPIYNLLSTVTDRKHSIAALKGIYSDVSRNCYIATDCSSLVSIPSSTKFKKSEVVDPETGLSIESKFPDYLHLVPVLSKRFFISSPTDLLSILSGLCRANKFIHGKIIYARIVLDDLVYLFDPLVLFKVLNILVCSGSKELFLEHYFPHPTKPQYTIIFRDAADTRKFGLAMAVMPGFDLAYKTVICSCSEWFNIPETLRHLQSSLTEEQIRRPKDLLFEEARLAALLGSSKPDPEEVKKCQSRVISEQTIWNDMISWWGSLINLLSKHPS